MNTIEFPQDTEERRKWFRAASFSHPAKMVLGLQIYLIEHYTKPGETILDPMAGSGTVLVGCALGRNIICVELEAKFCKMQEDNWEKIKSLGPMLGYKMGEATILKGDSRQLQDLLVDKCIFSPPFAGSKIESDADNKADRYGHYEHGGLKCDIPETNGQISALPYGEISAVISSPPYANPRNENGQAEQEYEDKRLGKDDKAHGRTAFRGRYADAVITSPPYEGIITGDDAEKQAQRKLERYEKGEFADTNIGRFTKTSKTILAGYSKSQENIGNLKSDNYLEAMLSVYRQCHKVLRDKGLLCLVVKNFIRDKKIVRLDTDTIKLCEKAGFVLKERLRRKLTQQSFWRIIYAKKFPDAPKIEFEDVLIFEARPNAPV